MHIDWVKETVADHERDHPSRFNTTILKSLCSEPELLALAESCGNEKIAGICANVRAAASHRYKKVTDNQRIALAAFLLEQFGSARAALAKAMGSTEQEMFGETAAEVITAPKSVPEAVAASRQQQTEDAAAFAAFVGLPSLKGTERQTAWAETLRASCLRRLSPEDADILLSQRGANTARFWIDRKQRLAKFSNEITYQNLLNELYESKRSVMDMLLDSVDSVY